MKTTEEIISNLLQAFQVAEWHIHSSDQSHYEVMLKELGIDVNELLCDVGEHTKDDDNSLQ